MSFQNLLGSRNEFGLQTWLLCNNACFIETARILGYIVCWSMYKIFNSLLPSVTWLAHMEPENELIFFFFLRPTVKILLHVCITAFVFGLLLLRFKSLRPFCCCKLTSFISEMTWYAKNMSFKVVFMIFWQTDMLAPSNKLKPSHVLCPVN